MENIEANVEEIVLSLREDDRIQITQDTNLFEVGILDSFKILEYIEALENAFGIRFSNEDLIPNNLWTIAATADYVRKRLP